MFRLDGKIGVSCQKLTGCRTDRVLLTPQTLGLPAPDLSSLSLTLQAFWFPLFWGVHSAGARLPTSVLGQRQFPPNPVLGLQTGLSQLSEAISEAVFLLRPKAMVTDANFWKRLPHLMPLYSVCTYTDINYGLSWMSRHLKEEEFNLGWLIYQNRKRIPLNAHLRSIRPKAKCFESRWCRRKKLRSMVARETFAKGIRVILRCWGNSSMVCQQNSDAL